MKLRLARKISLLVLATYLVWTLAACGTAISGSGSDDDCCETETGDCCDAGFSDDCCDDGSGNAALAEHAGTADVNYAELSDEELEALYLAEPAAGRTIHIGYSGGLCQAAIPVAQHYGFFEEEGLTTELVSSDDARDALAAGKIDTSAGMIAQWLTSVQNGVDIRFTLGLHTGCAAAVVLPDSGYDGFEKGMKIGFVGAFGGVYHNIALRFVAHDGFSSDDFTWLGFDQSAILLALQEGEVDAIVVSEQLSQQWVDDGDVKTIRSLTTDDDFKNEACCVLGISGTFLEENPVTSYKITRAVYRASLWIAESEENRLEAAKMMVENGYVSGTPEYSFKLLNYYRFGLTPVETAKSLYDSVDEYIQLGILSKDTDPEIFKEQIYYAYDFGDL